MPPGHSIDVAVTYGNFGGFSDTFLAGIWIDSAGVNVYNETCSLTIDPATDSMISFAPWITGGTTGIVYGGMAFTSLATDINPANDTMSFSIIITP